MKAIELLPGKYPHAFVPNKDGTPIRVDEKGRQYLVSWAVDGQANAVVTQQGTCRVSMSPFSLINVTDEVINAVEMSQLVDAAMDKFPSSGVGFPKALNGKDVSISVVANSGGSVREKAEELKKLFEYVEERFRSVPTEKPEVKDISELL